MQNSLLQYPASPLEWKSNIRKETKRDFISETHGDEVLAFVDQFIVTNKATTRILLKPKDLDLIMPKTQVEAVVNLHSFNNIRDIDSYFEQVNNVMQENAVFIGHIRTNKLRHETRKNRRGLSQVAKFLDFIAHRIPSKVSFLKPLYLQLTKGKNQRISKAEICGRFVRSGFTILSIEENLDGNMFFVGTKTGTPIRSDKPSSGLLYKMPRMGKNGKMIGVYKFRTMHAYSEYLQDYVLKENGYGPNGKPANDFRVTSWGKFMRKFWIDELPQLLNVLKGEMKLVGVRPVSKRYFQDIPKELQELRLSRKPGCIPPYVAFDMEGSKEGALASEERYLRLSDKYATLRDIRLVFQAINNIVIRRKRSA